MDNAEISMPVKPLSIDAIRAKADTSESNLTMLPKSFGRFAAMLSKDVLGIAPSAPSFTFEGFCGAEARLGREVEENSCLTELLVCGDFGQSVRVSVDRSAVFGLCSVVFGGVGNEPAYSEARPFSSIERAVTQLFIKTLGRTLPSAFPNIALKEFFLAPLQDPNEEPQYPPFEPFVSIKILCNIHGYSGELIIEIPQELALLFGPAANEPRAPEAPKISEWAMHISDRVEGIEIELVAILAEFQMSLDGITSLRAGQVINLENDIASPLTVSSENVKLFTAKLGQTARKFCLSIEMPLAVAH
jgi:flagellar motor switch protein FliM